MSAKSVRALSILAAVLLAGCGSGPAVTVELTATARDSAGFHVLELSHTLTTVAAEPHLLKLELDNKVYNTMQFADTMATIAAAHGAGKCLFLSGVRPSDWQDGTSLTWVVINVADGELSRVVRLIAPPDAISSEYRAERQHGLGVLAFDTGHAYGMHRNVDGVFLVARYPLPEGCSAWLRRYARGCAWS